MEKDADNNKPEGQKINPVVIMGNMAFQLSDILNMDNNPEVNKAMDDWMAKKEKALLRAEKRKATKRTYKKRR